MPRKKNNHLLGIPPIVIIVLVFSIIWMYTQYPGKNWIESLMENVFSIAFGVFIFLLLNYFGIWKKLGKKGLKITKKSFLGKVIKGGA